MTGEEGFLIEFYQMGGAVKVSAIDPVTGVEVSIVGSPGASRHDLSTLAIKKLRYVLERQMGRKDSPKDPGGGGSGGSGNRGGGFVV